MPFRLAKSRGISRSAARPGFTLVELLVVMVLLGLASSMVFLSVSGGMFRSEEKRFVHSFWQALVHARSASLVRGAPVQLLIDGEKRAYSVDGGSWEKIPETIQVEGEGIAEIRPDVFGVLFYPDGSSSGGTIDLKWEDSRVDRIEIDRLFGLVRLRRDQS